MDKFIKSCLRYPTLTAIVTVMVAALGLYSLLRMPRMEDPSITIRTGLVLAAYPGATSEQVEKQVTKTLESTLFKFQEVRKAKTFSTSRPGVCIINVELGKNVKQPDVFWAKLRHEMNLLKATALPKEVMGPILNSDFGDTVAMLVAVSGERYGYRELRDYVDQIQDALRGVGEVGKIATYGQQNEQIWVTSNLDRMSQYATDVLKVIGALGQRNVVQGAGSVRTEGGRIPLHTTGAFNTEEEIRKVMVGMSRTGQPIYLGDFAHVERRYQDPEFMVRFDGKPAVIVAVEMQKGNNIVDLGNRVDKALAQLRPLLPPDLKLDFIANQPQVVESRIAGMGHEFLLAIACVVLVTMVLLPMRVAFIAAMAIPVTMLSTVGVLNALGVQLHQVSIAALILVLGIVVDDAIVIADNYVELLDRKVARPKAAWRAATEVLVPVLTATLTIIASFLPLIILSGSAGEFILALPITVAVSLSVSFLVAIFLTPLLCRTFIKQGLHHHEHQKATSAKTFNALDLLQQGYHGAITYLMRHPAVAMGVGLGATVAGLGLFLLAPRQFFPNAERNQCVIDLWMPQGSRIEATDAALKRIEAHLAREKQVNHCATFVGQSAPRFYYNVNPQQPDHAYGQVIVNTQDAKHTGDLVASLQSRLARLVPEGMVIVKELQQGSVMEAPVEVRISGEDVGQLKILGRQIEDMLRADGRSRYVHTDYFNDAPMADIKLNTELASRLGMSYSGVSKLLSGAFDGIPVSTFWEGNRAIHIMLRVEADRRNTFDDVRNTYLTSAIADGKVPLRAVADLSPAWQTSRIVRRNGVPTLTVRSFAVPGAYPSALLKSLRPQIKALPLPPGYHLELGGEYANQQETFPEMLVALSLSLVAIYLILMLQFRNLTEPFVVMASIPLSLFGAVLGLLVTGNVFGFTAFMGMISLCGIVVRNAIILIDYIKEKRSEGLSVREAATLAGERRLRPIFLTTMAAAVGVTPMILSGSKLWSPLASVLAVGLIFSMFFTLLVVPVLYTLIYRPRKTPVPATLALSILFCVALSKPLHAQMPVTPPSVAGTVSDAPTLTLEQAVSRAMASSSGVKIAQAKVQEAQAKRRVARTDYYPHLNMDATWLHSSGEQLLRIPAGALGILPGMGPFPVKETVLGQGSQTLYLQNLTLGQPLTQLFKIRHGNEVADAEERMAQAEWRKMQSDMAFKVRQVYIGLLLARAKAEAAQLGVSAAQAQDQEAADAVKAGNALPVLQTGSRAQFLQSRHRLLTAQDTCKDLEMELNDLMGQPLDAPLALAALPLEETPLPARETLLQQALQNNLELAVARETLTKGQSALKAGKADHIPELSAFARHTHQHGVPFLRTNTTSVGLNFSWSIWDWGKKSGVVTQRASLVNQAAENLRRLESRLHIDLDKQLRKLETARLLVAVAEEAHTLNTEKVRLASNQHKAGVISLAKKQEAEATAKSSQADLLAARLGVVLAKAELRHLLGEKEG